MVRRPTGADLRDAVGWSDGVGAQRGRQGCAASVEKVRDGRHDEGSVVFFSERLVASIPESNMGNLKAGFQVVISAAYDAKRRANGSIERLAPVVDARTGSIKVFIDLETGQDQLLPGQFVRAKVKTDVHENVLVIPKSALVYQDGQPSVFVLGPPPKVDSEQKEESSENSEKDSGNSEKAESPPKATHSAISRDLKIGYSDDQLVEIVDGLKEGDRVITLGNTALRSGSPVRIEESVKSEDGEVAK